MGTTDTFLKPLQGLGSLSSSLGVGGQVAVSTHSFIRIIYKTYTNPWEMPRWDIKGELSASRSSVRDTCPFYLKRISPCAFGSHPGSLDPCWSLPSLSADPAHGLQALLRKPIYPGRPRFLPQLPSLLPRCSHASPCPTAFPPVPSHTKLCPHTPVLNQPSGEVLKGLPVGRPGRPPCFSS